MSAKKKILIVEDQEQLNDALQAALEGKGYVVFKSLTGEDALEQIKAQKPDLVLLDTILPGISGLEVLEALKDYRAANPLKIVMLSNVDDPEELKKARKYEIDDYLIKTDWRIEDILSRVARNL